MKEPAKQKLLNALLVNELTESVVYAKLAALQKNEKNRSVLQQIAEDEISHAKLISGLLGSANPKVNKLKVCFLVFCARFFGLTFSLKMMEKGENLASKKYNSLVCEHAELEKLAQDECRHENALLDMLSDSHLDNMGSIVLGLNDALVELTGALAGFTFAIGNSLSVAKLGFITGMAAAMSMAASAFLSSRAGSDAKGESNEKSPMVAALYTGGAYVITVFLLVTPYIVFSNLWCALLGMLFMAFAIIAFFNFYLSVAKGSSFRRGFFEMAAISTVVAVISYAIGYFLR
jgi:VIT1/CCC1 family predicted Fe2+/Mn2+ transporter